jgi:mannose-6-phosphate isomerase-like protein (cupin superfamily)
MPTEATPLSRTAAELDEFWSQHTIGEANGSVYRVAKGIGSTTWHHHDDQDEVFVVTEGELIIELETGDVRVGAGELFIVPRGVEHRPRADEETHVLLIEPLGTANTGDSGLPGAPERAL